MNYKLLFFLFGLFFSEPLYAQEIEQWGCFEGTFKCKSQKNAFKDVILSAEFSTSDTTYSVSGFYDGNNTFKIRFMSQKTGKWQYKTVSNSAELNNQKGEFMCIIATKGNVGLVRVSDTYNFKYANGQNYYPFGTTAYA